MQPRSRTALAVFFGSLVGLTLVVSQFVDLPATTVGQVTHSETESNAGFVVQPNTHVYFSCPGDSALLSPSMGTGSDYAFWMYEFTGDEPPWNGRFFIAEPVLSQLNIDPSFSTLKTILADNTYYITSEDPLVFRCGEGVRPQAVCGNGLVESGEQCDSVSGCNACEAETGYSCDSVQNTCTVLVPTLDSSSSSSEASQVSLAISSARQEPLSSSSTAVSSSTSSSSSSSSSVTTSYSQRSLPISSQSNAPTNAPMVEYNQFEMEYAAVPASNSLKAGNEFQIALNIKNTANGPRKFRVIHNTGVSDAVTTTPYEPSTAVLRAREDYITANTRQQDSECSTKPAPYFGRWRTFCEYILAPGEERTLQYDFTVEQDFNCTSSLLANVSLETSAGFYKKPFNRYVRVFPENCGFGVSTNTSCVPLAAAQSLQDNYANPQYTKDKTFMTYTVDQQLYSLDIPSCTETLLAEASDESMAIGEVYVSENKDVFYERTQWYTVSGRPARSLHRIDGATGEDEEIVPYAPKNTGVGSTAFSKDGTRVAFVATWVNLDNNLDESTELYLWEDGVITQLTTCNPAQHDRYNDCIIVNPRFVENTDNLTVQTDYNPKTGAPHEPRYTIKMYRYDLTEGKFL